MSFTADPLSAPPLLSHIYLLFPQGIVYAFRGTDKSVPYNNNITNYAVHKKHLCAKGDVLIGEINKNRIGREYSIMGRKSVMEFLSSPILQNLRRKKQSNLTKYLHFYIETVTFLRYNKFRKGAI